MTARSITSPEDQSATFIELFFDLVFVFSVTQVVGILHDGFDAVHLGRAALVFWLVWWAWTQFTWALNAADTTHPIVEFGVLVATAIAFFMAVAVPEAFGNRALAFAIPYVAVRALGLVLYGWVASSDRSQHAAVRIFAFASLGGLIAVVAGAVIGGDRQYWLWGLAILLDIGAAALGGNMEGWNLHPDHFGERHGLFVIIALGESMIVAAGGLAGAQWDGNLIAVAVLSVAVTCALWWSYFSRCKPVLDAVLASSSGKAQSSLARDAYSLVHFAMICGIIGFAAVVEEMILHPREAVVFPMRLALAGSLALFVGGLAVAFWRATGTLLVSRLALVLVTGSVVAAFAGAAPGALTVALIGVVTISAIEERSINVAAVSAGSTGNPVASN